MTPIAIDCRKLGKRYSASLRARSSTLRETLAAGPAMLRDALRAGRTERAKPRELWALRDLTLSIRQGSSVGVIGRNGAGKSTLLKIISSVTRPTEGFVDVAGRVGSLLEVGTGFHSELTGRENIRLYGAILGMSGKEVASRFDEIVAFAELEDFLDTPVKRYSSGMYMRLAFAVASHLDPEILLVDEVLAVGDLGFQRKSMNRVGKVAGEGRTVLFVSHNLQAVQRLCPESLILHDGRLVDFGETRAMISRYLSEFSTDSASGTWIPVDAIPRRREGGITIMSVRYTGEGDSAQPASRRPFAVEFDVMSESDMRAGSAAVIVYDRFGTKLINADSAALGGGVPLRKGINRIRFDFPRLGVSPGTYALGLWIARGSRDTVGLDFIENAAWLDVTDPDSPFIGGAVDEGSIATDFSYEPRADSR